jgi:hypothetical protein
MKRLRLSTLMLLIVITALCVAFVVQQQRATADRRRFISSILRYEYRIKRMEEELADRRQSLIETAKVKEGDRK